MVQLITIQNLVEIPIIYFVINDVEKWWRSKDLSHYNLIIIIKILFSMMLIWKEWTTNNKLNKLKKRKMSNMNTITTTQKIFMMRRLIMMRILIRTNWMGY